MKKWTCVILGTIAVLYGIVILRVGSGTMFWLVWEAIGISFFGLAYLVHRRFFDNHQKLRRIFRCLMLTAIVVLAVFCGMIGSKFASKGQPNLEYLIVLGAQVRSDGPSIVLKYRLDTAFDYLNENLDTICIVSGGQGANEPFSEAKGMAEYLIEKGIAADRILLEDQSRNTVENIRYSMKLMGNAPGSVGIVTNNFHVFRAVQIARMNGLEYVHGIAADSNIFYLPNNVLRECGGIFKDWLFGNC